MHIISTIVLTSDVPDSLYSISSQEKAVAMWMASPSYYSGATQLVTVDCDTYVNYNGYYFNNVSCGFRPVVCLNSNVQLEKKIDGTYAIK